MYLKTLELWNWRKFKRNLEQPGMQVILKEGLNLLIGENDSGKTAIIDAIRMVLGTNNDKNWITENDFSRGTKELKIECVFENLTEKEQPFFMEWLSFSENNDDLIVSLRIKLTATIYTDLNGDERVKRELVAGPKGIEQGLPSEVLNYLHITYLKPLRDAATELEPGYRSRLAKIIENLPEFQSENKQEEIKELFINAFQSLEKELQTPVLEQIERNLKKFLVANDDRVPELESKGLTFKEVLRRLRLQLSDQNSGLGTSNMLFMALELIALRSEKEIGLQLTLIEEIEAHLHPQAQLRVIKEFEQTLEKNSSAQYILTTHSPTLAASISMKHLNVIYNNNAYSMNSGHSLLEENDYKFLDRFLDVTKANLFFAKGVILVEGYAENILVPTIAKMMDKSLHEYGISIVNVQGTYFERFTKIFLRKNKDSPMNFPVAVITDLDIKPILNYLSEAHPPQLLAENNKQKETEKIYQYPSDLQTTVASSITEKQVSYKHNTENIKVFFAKPWTLEHSILQSELEDIFETIMIDDWYEDSSGEPLRKRKKGIEKGTNITQDRASQIYNAMLSISKSSKSIAAQKLANYLIDQEVSIEQLKVKESYKTLRSEQAVNGLEYIMDAINHVVTESNNSLGRSEKENGAI